MVSLNLVAVHRSHIEIELQAGGAITAKKLGKNCFYIRRQGVGPADPWHAATPVSLAVGDVVGMADTADTSFRIEAASSGAGAGAGAGADDPAAPVGTSAVAGSVVGGPAVPPTQGAAAGAGVKHGDGGEGEMQSPAVGLES